MIKKLSKIFISVLLVSAFVIPVIGNYYISSQGSNYNTMDEWPRPQT